ncbi:MAG: hypothetical protein OXT74_05760 [Candidatus Poribacteria bacterium]|nr:hypothetical protein [Candidatus Poribacteria bacterium]
MSKTPTSPPTYQCFFQRSVTEKTDRQSLKPHGAEIGAEHSGEDTKGRGTPESKPPCSA